MASDRKQLFTIDFLAYSISNCSKHNKGEKMLPLKSVDTWTSFGSAYSLYPRIRVLGKQSFYSLSTFPRYHHPRVGVQGI